MQVTVTALELFLLHKQLNHCAMANKRHKQPHFSRYNAETQMRRHMHQTWIHKQEHISLLMFNCI
jgi:hypothetical protein